MKIKKKHFSVTFIASLLILYGCIDENEETKNINTKGINMTNTQIKCFGRYIVNLPIDLTLNMGGRQEINGIEIAIIPMKKNDVEHLIQRRKSELDAMKMADDQSHPILRSSQILAGSNSGIIFDRAGSDVSGGRFNRILELISWKNGYKITATVPATDSDFTEYQTDPDFKTLFTNINEIRNVLLDVVQRTSGRDDFSIPTEKGICIHNGFVSGSAKDKEEITIFYELKSTNDVHFSFNTSNLYARDDTLVGRSKKNDALLTKAGGHIIRRGAHKINGANEGEEILYTILSEEQREPKSIMTHRFVFEANNKIGSVATPLLRIEFANGVRKPMPYSPNDDSIPTPIPKPTLSEAEAINLWDSVIPTIRPRPGAF